MKSLFSHIARRVPLRALCASLLLAATATHAQQTVVANYTGNSLLIVDLASGSRTILSDATTGTGTALNRPVGIAREANGNILVGQDLSDSVVFRIDPTNGNRTILSGSTVGAGPALGFVYGLTVDSEGAVFASCFSGGLIVKIDPVTGDRTTIASSTVGSGAVMGGPWGIAAEPDGNLVVAMNSSSALVRVNPTTGVRTVISSSTVGTGNNLVSPTGLARLPDGSYLVLNRDAADYLIRVDSATGNRTVVSSSTRGNGPTIGSRFGLSFDSNGVFYVADFSANAVLRIDPATGDRTVVASATVGAGPAFSLPLGILPGAVASVTNTSPTPVITSAATASAAYGSAFTYTITADNGATSYSAAGLPPGLSLDAATGIISGAPAESGSFSITLGATNDDGSGSTTLALNVAPKALTVSGLTARSRSYDATTAATLDTAGATLVGVVGSDAVALDASAATASFADKNVGTGKPVSIAGLALSGAQAANYTLGAPTASADITPATLTLDGMRVQDKPYDGTTAGTWFTDGATLAGKFYGDNVAPSLSGATPTFDSAAVGTNKLVTFSGITLIGSEAANYLLTQPTTTASITARSVAVTGVTVAAKIYDGTLTATPSFAGATLVGVSGNDAVALVTTGATATFASASVGSAKAVSIAGLALTGADAVNYTLAQPAATGDVTPATLTVSGVTAADRVYDASAAAALNFANATIVGIRSGDAVSLVTAGATGTFDTKNVGTAKVVTLSGLALSGADAANYTLTQPQTSATIAAKHVTVTGVSAANKTYDGTTTATLDFGTAALTGVVSGDVVTLDASAASGSFAAADAAPAQTVSITGLALSGADAANYTVVPPATSADISPATATVTLAGLSQSYAGTARVVTATTTPAGLTTTMTYNGASTAPANAGSYTVVATVADRNYSGSATSTLVVAKADQSVSFAAPAGPMRVGSTIVLEASASSGLPITFELVDGNATLAGDVLTLKDVNPVTVRALQEGDGNYNAVSVERTITATAKLQQTIDFRSLSLKRVGDPAFALSATASSGLPVTFTILSGPAMVSGSTVTLGGTKGAVVVRATQAGDATYDAAPAVTQSFEVLGSQDHLVFFGSTGTNDTLAIDLAPNGTSATLLCYIAASNEAYAVKFDLVSGGTFESAGAPLSVQSADDTQVAGHAVAKAAAVRTFRGSLVNGVFRGTIVELGLDFSAALEPVDGPTAGIAGLYESSALNAAAGTTSSIVGTQGQVLVVAATGTLSTGGLGSVSTDGEFTVDVPCATIVGSVNEPTATVTGSIVIPTQPTVEFSGIAANALRTDRLVNLSSRSRVGTVSANGTLITGFVVGGTEPKRVLLRAVGPTLAEFGVTGALANPRLRLYTAAGDLVVENDDWSGNDVADAAALVGAFGLASGSRDAAVLTTLAPGAYTMHVVGDGGSGVAMAEIYDASVNPQGEYQRLVNISTRGMVESGEGALIGGFVVTGNSPKKVLVRGVGPALAAFGVDGTLANPVVAVYRGNTVVAQNNDWSTPMAVMPNQVVASAADVTAAARATGAFEYAAGSKDAAVVVTLAPGAYTAQVTSADGSTGVALVEVYELSE